MARHLTAEQIEQLKDDMARHHDGLQRQLREHLHGKSRAERAHEVMQQDGDDAPQRAPERDIAAALTVHEQQELLQVSDAIRRLNEAPDGYGVCFDCDADIPFARLKAEPWTTRCIECAEVAERQAARGFRATR